MARRFYGNEASFLGIFGLHARELARPNCPRYDSVAHETVSVMVNNVQLHIQKYLWCTGSSRVYAVLAFLSRSNHAKMSLLIQYVHTMPSTLD